MNNFRNIENDIIAVDNLIVGSGAGGSTTANELTKLNQEFLIIEEGINPTNKKFDKAGHLINSLYYNNGATPMFSISKGPVIGYGQGRCVGGSTYVNAGYFSLTPKYIFNRWVNDGSIDFDYDQYQKFINEIKNEIDINLIKRNSLDIDSNNIFEACTKLNWNIEYCHRFISEDLKYQCPINDCSCDILNCKVHKKQSMNFTYLKDPIEQNKILYNFKVDKILFNNNSAHTIIAINQENKKKIKISFKKLFINCGPINSFGLLKKNNLVDNSLEKLNNFEFHLNFKVIVKFNLKVNSNLPKASSFFLREFEKEGVLLSTSNSEIPYLLASLSHYDPKILKDVIDNYDRYSMYVYQIKSYSKGKIKNSFGSSFVQYNFDKRDYLQIQLAIKRISQLFSNIGAELILFPISNDGLIKSNKEAIKLSNNFDPKDLHLVSVHGMSTLRSSNNKVLGHTNRLGKLNNFNNIYVNDASIIPTNTGESPQATIMAMAKYNVKNLKF